MWIKFSTIDEALLQFMPFFLLNLLCTLFCRETFATIYALSCGAQKYICGGKMTNVRSVAISILNMASRAIMAISHSIECDYALCTIHFDCFGHLDFKYIAHGRLCGLNLTG